MADNKYKNQFCCVDSSTLISNYVISYCIIAMYKVSSMCNTNNYIQFHTSVGILYFITQEVGPVFLKSGLKQYIQQMTLPSQVLCGI